MSEDNLERQLVEQYAQAKAVAEVALAAAETSVKNMNEIEDKLRDYLMFSGKTSSAKYADLGHVTLQKPRISASCDEGNRQVLFEHLRGEDRDDMIKETVAPGSLASYIKDRIEANLPVPGYIFVRFTHKVLFYPANKKRKQRR